MKNVTILLAVVAMLAVTAQAAPLVDEDFSSDPGWIKDMDGGISDFGYDDTAHAITGTWKSEANNSRYYIGIDELDQSSAITFSFDITPVSGTSNGTAFVGLLNTGGGNDTDNFSALVFFDGTNWKLFASECEHGSTSVQINQILLMTPGTLYHCHFQYDGSGGLVARAWADGQPEPVSESGDDDGYYSGVGWGPWTVNAFGTTNFRLWGGQLDIVVDDMYLVPEPATLALLGLGGIGVLLRRRRK